MSVADTSATSGSKPSIDGVIKRESPFRLESDLRAKLQKELGLDDDQLNAWLAIADDDIPNSSLSSEQFNLANKETLNAIDKSGQLSQLARKLVAVRAPVAMMSEVSNPRNWQKEQYIGPGAMAVSAFMQPGSALPLEDLNPPIDPNNISLDALVMSILTQRAEIIEVQLREQITAIQQKNKELEVANGWLTRSKEQKANAGTSGTTPFTAEFRAYWDSLGAEYQHKEGGHNSADWDVNIEGLKAKIEALTSQSQLETTKLQQTINKYNQSFEMLSNFINKYYQSVNTIIQNLR